MNDHVILVDARDVPLGTAEKYSAHLDGVLHRAFSIFVFNDAGEVLLQRRARGKYHSAGLWSNTCCSHPRPGEDTGAAAHRRLVEELGFDCALETAFTFIYRADVGSGLIEHEYDHLLMGWWNGTPTPNPTEVDAWRWLAPHQLTGELRARPDRFTFWLRVAWEEMRTRGLLHPTI